MSLAQLGNVIARRLGGILRAREFGRRPLLGSGEAGDFVTGARKIARELPCRLKRVVKFLLKRSGMIARQEKPVAGFLQFRGQAGQAGHGLFRL